MPPIEDHPLRYQLANELHARPFPALQAPARAVYLAIKKAQDAASRDRSEDLDHLLDLLDRYGTQHPQPGATHFTAAIGKHVLKWEQHTEFVTYTVFLNGLGERPYDPADFEVFPDDWLRDAPGVRVTSAMLRICERPEDEDRINDMTRDWMVADSLAVSRVIDDAVVVVGDQQLSLRAQHAFGALAPDRSEFEGKVLARDIGAHGGKHGDETGARVGGAADDVVDRAVAGIDLTDPQLVGVGVLLGGDDPGHDEGGQRAFLDLFEFESDGGQLVGDGAQVSVGVEVLFEPIKGEFHGLAPPDQRREKLRFEAVVLQPAHVAVEEGPQVGNAVLEHGQSFDADAESKALILVRVEAAIAQHIRVHHAGTEHLKPIFALTNLHRTA